MHRVVNGLVHRTYAASALRSLTHLKQQITTEGEAGVASQSAHTGITPLIQPAGRMVQHIVTEVKQSLRNSVRLEMRPGRGSRVQSHQTSS
eukprot:766590-Hanusia_phi.AAC.1